MPVSDCLALHDEYFSLLAPKHNVFMWTIDKFLHDTEAGMLKAGFKLHARIIWDKENGVAPAFTVRFSHEYLLWFYRPKCMLMPVKEQRGMYTTVIREASTIHSKKPIAAYEMIETMFPNSRKLEMFARNTRSGWESMGDEL
jgi:N6-adenosine-specific RNA methylase IME4